VPNEPYVRYSVSPRRTPSTVIDDYAATAGKRPTEHGTTQRGDAAKAAKGIVAAVESGARRIPAAWHRCPRHLPHARDARLDTIQTWEHLTTNTDIDA
jgi:hypothetical protein